MNKTRGGIFLLLLAILFVGSGCGTVRAWNAEPYGRHGMIEIPPPVEAPAVALEVPAPEAVKPLVVKRERVEVKKMPRKSSRTVSSAKDGRCNCATKPSQIVSGADKAPWFCLFCVTQNVTK